jgi:hypothetical protein
MEQDYAVFIHLAGADGQPVAQVDSQPLSGRQPLSGGYPTSFWDKGEFLADPYSLLVPEDVLPGEYELRVGMYLPASGGRLPLLDADGQVLGDSISLGWITVRAP